MRGSVSSPRFSYERQYHYWHQPSKNLPVPPPTFFVLTCPYVERRPSLRHVASQAPPSLYPPRPKAPLRAFVPIPRLCWPLPQPKTQRKKPKKSEKNNKDMKKKEICFRLLMGSLCGDGWYTTTRKMAINSVQWGEEKTALYCTVLYLHCFLYPFVSLSSQLFVSSWV